MKNDLSFYRLLASISGLSGMLPVIFAFINIKHIKKHLSPIFILLLISLIIEIIDWKFSKFSQNNLDIFHLFTIIEFILISLFYILYFKQYIKPLTFVIIIPIFLIIAITEYIVKGPGCMKNISTSVESILLVSYSLFFYFFVMKRSLYENILTVSTFWINSAVLTYFSGNLLLFVFSSYLNATDMKNYTFLWATIHSFFNIMFNILLSIGFWKIRANRI